MDTYKPLYCDLHDYLEIACMHHYDLHIELIDGRHLQAKALTTRTSKDKEEFFSVVFSAQNGEEEQEIRQDQLLAITPLDEKASFSRIVLAESFCTCDSRKS